MSYHIAIVKENRTIYIKTQITNHVIFYYNMYFRLCQDIEEILTLWQSTI